MNKDITENNTVKNWMKQVVNPRQIEKYLNNGEDFIDENLIFSALKQTKNPTPEQIRDIIAKAESLSRLDPHETAALINLPADNATLWDEIFHVAKKIKTKVYGRRIVTFAPLYVSNYCVNNCLYCGYRTDNSKTARKQLNDADLISETKALIKNGHKRLIMVYGEHPASDADFIAHTLKTVYSVKEGNGEIRRANINAAPLSIEHLEMLKDVGIGTFQVFQETYHRETYAKVHPTGIKSDYRWRLYALHRSLEAGADDVGMGALFGLYDWRFEVMSLLLHTIDLEDKFGGIGPHTISFPRLVSALGTPFVQSSPWLVDDQTFKRLVAIIRLSVPYTGMILTCREPAQVRDEIIELGVTQLDFGSHIGIGEYSDSKNARDKQQFSLNDARSLDEGIRWLAERGYITSFCTAGYRCGRTGEQFMDVAKHGKVHQLCMPNAILTFQEYLLDYASAETKQKGEYLIKQELDQITNPQLKEMITGYLERIRNGERDLYV